MLKTLRKSEKGFTLIELLIVVAIIGILAAIAIPQFAAYRTKGYNSASTSDLRNMRTTQESLFADYQSYGNFAAPGAAATAGAALYTPLTNVVATQIANEEVGFTPSAGVAVGCSLVQSAAPAPQNDFITYVIVTKHLNGDRTYGVDAEDVGIWWKLLPAKGTQIDVAAVPAANQLGNQVGAAPWSQM